MNGMPYQNYINPEEKIKTNERKVKKIYFIFDYPCDSSPEYDENSKKNKEQKYVVEEIDSSVINNKDNNEIYSKEYWCKYKVFRVTILLDDNPASFTIYFKNNNVSEHFQINLAINQNQNKNIFLFNISVKEKTYKFFSKEMSFKSFLSDIDKLIIFKRALKKKEIFDEMTLKNFENLVDDGFSILPKDRVSRFYFLLVLFSIKKDDCKIIEKIIEQCQFYSFGLRKPKINIEDEDEKIKSEIDKADIDLFINNDKFRQKYLKFL